MTFNECCAPFIHNKKNAPTPLALMRSRYSAYTLKQIDYLLQTQCQIEDPLTMYHEISEFANHAYFQHLEIVASEDHSVEYKAYYILNHRQELLHEKSNFTCKDGIWCYKEGTIFSTPVTFKRNDPCICGSGKKYKRCCGLL
ncbi:MAG: YchJ family metal-binding protein [Campylobacterota bacterium]|nr:YchJ family metal-binding protein [Campylobacterota bacterium]